MELVITLKPQMVNELEIARVKKTMNSDYGTLNNTKASDGKRTRNSQNTKTLNSDYGTRDEKNKDKETGRCFSSIASSDIPEIRSSSQALVLQTLTHLIQCLEIKQVEKLDKYLNQQIQGIGVVITLNFLKVK